MKYLLVALVLIVAIGVWRNNRRKAKPAAASAPQKPTAREAENMVTCAHCGVHLPRSDALQTTEHSFFCSTEHQRLGSH